MDVTDQTTAARMATVQTAWVDISVDSSWNLKQRFANQSKHNCFFYFDFWAAASMHATPAIILKTILDQAPHSPISATSALKSLSDDCSSLTEIEASVPEPSSSSRPAQQRTSENAAARRRSYGKPACLRCRQSKVKCEGNRVPCNRCDRLCIGVSAPCAISLDSL